MTVPSTTVTPGWAIALSFSLVAGGNREEVVDLGVVSGYLLQVLGSSWSSAGGDVRTWWRRLHQCHLLRLRQVLQLYRHQCKVSDGDHPFLLVPVQYVLLLQPIRMLAYSTTSGQCITLLNVIKREQSIVAVTHVVSSEVDTGTVACRADH